MSDKPWLSSLTFIGFYLTAALDAGKGPQVTFDDVYKGLENGTLLQDLQARLPNTFDFSLFPQGSDKERELLDVLNEVAGGLEGRERRKTGVEKSGIALLLAFILEAIQAHQWTQP
jgi:hypothetical protein